MIEGCSWIVGLTQMPRIRRGLANSDVARTLAVGYAAPSASSLRKLRFLRRIPTPVLVGDGDFSLRGLHHDRNSPRGMNREAYVVAIYEA